MTTLPVDIDSVADPNDMVATAFGQVPERCSILDTGYRFTEIGALASTSSRLISSALLRMCSKGWSRMTKADFIKGVGLKNHPYIADAIRKEIARVAKSIFDLTTTLSEQKHNWKPFYKEICYKFPGCLRYPGRLYMIYSYTRRYMADIIARNRQLLRTGKGRASKKRNQIGDGVQHRYITNSPTENIDMPYGSYLEIATILHKCTPSLLHLLSTFDRLGIRTGEQLSDISKLPQDEIMCHLHQWFDEKLFTWLEIQSLYLALMDLSKDGTVHTGYARRLEYEKLRDNLPSNMQHDVDNTHAVALSDQCKKIQSALSVFFNSTQPSLSSVAHICSKLGVRDDDSLLSMAAWPEDMLAAFLYKSADYKIITLSEARVFQGPFERLSKSHLM